MTGYVRVDTGNNIADGNVISAADLDNEFDGIQAAFNASTGHNHDGTTGEGAPILVLGPTQDVVVGASTVTPKTTNTVDIGSSSLKFKDLYMAGNASIGGTLGVTGATTLSAALTYGGVTLSNAVTGTGNMVLSASPTLTGTLSGVNASLSGTLAVTGVATLTAQPILSSLTASRAVFTDGSKGLVSNAITGTGNVVMSASPTLTGTITAEALTLSGAVTASGGTANGVAYLNGSKVLTTGSALTFDGSTVTNTGVGYSVNNANALLRFGNAAATRTGYLQVRSDAFEVWSDQAAVPMVFGVSNTEQMRLTSTGLGIGTSSPGYKLTVAGGDIALDNTRAINFKNAAGGYGNVLSVDSSNRVNFGDLVTSASAMVLASGNLGLGVTPSAWGAAFDAMEFGAGSGYSSTTSVASAYDSSYFVNNAYYADAVGMFKYVGSNYATQYQQYQGQHRWFTAPSGTAGNAISFTQAMTLDASGFLGVGETSPTSRIHANGTIQARTGATGVQIYGDGGSGYVNSVGSNPLIFQVNSTERARIDSSGNLLVGTTSALPSFSAARLTVRAGSGASGFVAQVQTAAFECGAFWNTDTASNNIFALFGTEATYTTRGSITYNRAGGLTAYNTTSDYRAKDIIGPVNDSGALIDSTPVYMGKMKGATQERPMFIAHETPAYAHTGEKDAVDADGNPVYQQMDVSALVPVMWAEIQSLRQRLAAAGI